MHSVCQNCGVSFEPPPKNPARRSCSRSCAVALAWKDPVKAAKRRASVTAARRRPESRAKSTQANNARWAKPGNREKLSEWNKGRWAKPSIKKQLSRAIRKAQGTPEQRAFYSRMRTHQWAADAEYRRKTVDGMRSSNGTPEARALFSRLLRERWQDPAMREKYTAANHQRNNPEHRERMRAQMLARWRDDEDFRALVATSMEFYWSQPEAREFHSRKLKALWADPVWRMRQLSGLNKKGATKGKITEHLNSATDLMGVVNSVIPAGLPDFMRADIASDIMLALLENELKLGDLKSAAKTYIAEHRKMFPDKWGPISIDAPLPGTDGFTLADTLSNETPHF